MMSFTLSVVLCFFALADYNIWFYIFYICRGEGSCGGDWLKFFGYFVLLVLQMRVQPCIHCSFTMSVFFMVSIATLYAFFF